MSWCDDESEFSDSYDSDEDADYDPKLEGVNEDDRAMWCDRYHEELTLMHSKLLEDGRQVFGNAFFQLGNFATFSYFIYKYTTP